MCPEWRRVDATLSLIGFLSVPREDAKSLVKQYLGMLFLEKTQERRSLKPPKKKGATLKKDTHIETVLTCSSQTSKHYGDLLDETSAFPAGDMLCISQRGPKKIRGSPPWFNFMT